MADEKVVDPKPKEGGGDEIKNLKAEMDRKIGNIEKTNQALLTQLQVIANNPKKETPPPPEKKSIRDTWYEDPDAAANMIVKKAKNDALTEIRSENAAQAKKSGVIQKLYQEYPELQDFDNPLTVKAVEIFEKLPEEEKAHPMAYRLAVKEAAEDLDIKPKAKRKAKEEADDSFALTGGTGNASKTRSRRSGELDQRTVDFAKLVGLDPSNEKTQANLKKHAERKNWLTWE